MKMKDIKVDEIYAVKRYSGKSLARRVVEGFEQFNPDYSKGKVMAVDLERIVGYDFEKQKDKIRKGYVRVLFAGRDDVIPDDPTNGYTRLVPTSSIVTTWAVYEETRMKYDFARELAQQKDIKNRKKAEAHLATICRNLERGTTLKKGSIEGYIPGTIRRVSVEEYLKAAHISLNYSNALSIAETLQGRKIDVPVIA